MAFIKGPKEPGCIFCTKPQERRDRENYILYRGAHAFIILNAYPYNNGHLMVVPYAHVPTLEQLGDDASAEVMSLVRRSLGALRRASAPAGFNVGANIGQAAGAGIADHVHVHVVPRWAGDTNFMPVIAEVRLVPETLESTYDSLIAAGIAADQPA